MAEGVASSPAMDADQPNSRPRSGSAAASPTIGRSNTLKKRSSVSRRSSLRPSSSRKSLRGPIAGVSADFNSADYTPVPTHGTPTDILADRFQSWRAYLKSLITYFREVQTSYEARSKTVVKVLNVISNTPPPSISMSEGGLADATRLLTEYHKSASAEPAKARDVLEDVIQALQGLRSDLSAKVKEIKALHGDFRNSVDKEKEGTKRAISSLDEALQNYDHNDQHHISKNDPFIVRLGVDRMVEKQIDEENYLHRAYLNLENSGRELESIIVGEIQKAFYTFGNLLKQEADHDYALIENLRTGPIAMPKDFEWRRFVTSDSRFVNPDLPIRKAADIDYPGKSHPATTEIRAGMLERKSKYLKSYSPGWYILSPTHLHEFKSADTIYSQPPVMSLFLADQKLGSHSGPESSSHKFMLKGRQSGGVHRGHSWVFRAESHETMMAWFDAIKVLTEKTGAERNAYVRQHAKSVSTGSNGPLSISSGEIEEDEADQVPYSASIKSHEVVSPEVQKLQRPSPGGRFPSDLAIPRVGRPSTESTSDAENEALDRFRGAQSSAAASAAQTVPASVAVSRLQDDPYRVEGIATHSNRPSEDMGDLRPVSEKAYPESLDDVADAGIPKGSGSENTGMRNGVPPEPTIEEATTTNTFILPVQSAAPAIQVQPDVEPKAAGDASPADRSQPPGAQSRQGTYYGDWMSSSAKTHDGIKPERTEATPKLPTPNDTSLAEPEFAVAGAAPATVEVPSTVTAAPALLTVPGAGADSGNPSSAGGPSLAPTSAASLGDSSWSSSPGGQGYGAGALNANGISTAGQPGGLARQETSATISNLHVPGEYPKSATADKDVKK